ncbi:hypothetical protein [Sorangium atrum]|uniref:Uncharacterized protein n=1 Tax=Sorangium atrum TaxID=2995308 RepID=A0ABT5C6G8_9BACT|nr:hypothetical protein [Sorangium aterium]MDC0680766.1 hypothetical protein [Sorangium aterium]
MSTGSITSELGVTRGDLLPKGGDQPDRTQIPIDSKLRFLETSTGTPLLHVAVTGLTPPGGFIAKTEYWSRLAPIKSRAITLASFGFTNRPGAPDYPKEFRDWLVGGSVLSTDQEASGQQWTQGIYQPTSPASALYWAVDPDGPIGRRIGLLVELGSAGELRNAIWYKMERPQNGLIFQRTPSKVSFAQLFVGDTPSIDPRDIDPQSAWYYYHGVMRPA